jgi:hypothetical protein
MGAIVARRHTCPWRESDVDLWVNRVVLTGADQFRSAPINAERVGTSHICQLWTSRRLGRDANRVVAAYLPPAEPRSRSVTLTRYIRWTE